MEAFLNDPDLVWEWYNFRRGLLKRVEPNDGHLVLAKMEKYYRNFLVSTQNVDGLHQRAGSGNVRELHGNILNSKCAKCNKPYENDEPIKCECGGFVRPDVVWFGEYLPENALEDSFKAAMDADLYLSVGTSANVYPAALLPMEAKNHGAYVIEINLEQTPLSNQVDFSIQDYSGNVLPKLWSIIDREGK
jgi:NAD-dependent deacetylase